MLLFISVIVHGNVLYLYKCINNLGHKAPSSSGKNHTGMSCWLSIYVGTHTVLYTCTCGTICKLD